MANFVICKGYSGNKCFARGTGIGTQFPKENPPARLYALYSLGQDPDDCRYCPSQPMVWQYKDPKEGEDKWKEFFRWSPVERYTGYLYSFMNINPTITAWGNWRVLYGSMEARFNFGAVQTGTCDMIVTVRDATKATIIPGATVTFMTTSSTPIAVLTTDAQGQVKRSFDTGYMGYASAQKTGYNQMSRSKSAFTACTPVTLYLDSPEAPPGEEEKSWYRIRTRDDMNKPLGEVKIEKGTALLGTTSAEGCLPTDCSKAYPSDANMGQSIDFKASKTGYNTIVKTVNFPAYAHEMDIYINMPKKGTDAQGKIISVNPQKFPAGIFTLEAPFKVRVGVTNKGSNPGKFKLHLFLHDPGTLLDIEPTTWLDIAPGTTKQIEVGVPSWQYAKAIIFSSEDEKFQLKLYEEGESEPDDIWTTPESEIPPEEKGMGNLEKILIGVATMLIGGFILKEIINR